MAKRESTDAAGTGADTEKGLSTDPWPEAERDTDGTAADDEPTATDQTSDDDNETGTTPQGDETLGGSDDHSHGCDTDNDVPCRFQ